MKNNNLFFYDGVGTSSSKQIALNHERMVIVKDANSKFTVGNIKSIGIECEAAGISIKLGSEAIFFSANKKIVINDNGENIVIEVIHNEERLSECKEMINAQEVQGLIDYIEKYIPDLFTREKLQQKTLSELKQIKESMDELANSY
ncbi:MAG: hypothetical protein ACM3TR_15325 [Caulobacteraceae bacterium]